MSLLASKSGPSGFHQSSLTAWIFYPVFPSHIVYTHLKMSEFCVVSEGIKPHDIQNVYHSPSVLCIGFNAIRHLSLGMAMTYGGKFILEEAVKHSERKCVENRRVGFLKPHNLKPLLQPH